MTIGCVFFVPAVIALIVSWFAAIDDVTFIVFAFIGMGAGAIFMKISSEYLSKKKALISEYVVQAMLEDNFEQVEYNPTGTFSYEHLAASGLRWTGSKGNDVFKAGYKGVTFAFSDVELWRGVGRHRTDVLRGQLLIIDLHRELSTPLMVSEIERRGRDSFSKGDRLQQFEGRFHVFCKSDELASQVLTPGFVEFLHERSDSQHLFFDGKTVHYGKDTRCDFFEPCSNVRDIPAVRERIQDEIDDIKHIIDGFLLNQYLFPVEAPGSENESDQAPEEPAP